MSYYATVDEFIHRVDRLTAENRVLRDEVSRVRDDLRDMQQTVAVLRDALLSRLPETALEPLGPRQQSLLSRLVHEELEREKMCQIEEAMALHRIATEQRYVVDYALNKSLSGKETDGAP